MLSPLFFDFVSLLCDSILNFILLREYYIFGADLIFSHSVTFQFHHKKFDISEEERAVFVWKNRIQRFFFYFPTDSRLCNFSWFLFLQGSICLCSLTYMHTHVFDRFDKATAARKKFTTRMEKYSLKNNIKIFRSTFESLGIETQLYNLLSMKKPWKFQQIRN